MNFLKYNLHLMYPLPIHTINNRITSHINHIIYHHKKHLFLLKIRTGDKIMYGFKLSYLKKGI